MPNEASVIPSERIRQLGIQLPKPWGTTGELATHFPGTVATLGGGVKVYAEFVRVVGTRVTVSGHLPINADGVVDGPYGRVGSAVTVEQAESCAQRCMLAILSSLIREIGTLDRIAAWVRLYGMVNADPDFYHFPRVINPASRLLYEIFGPQIGKHSRVAIGVAGLPFNGPVEIEAELELTADPR